MPRRRPENDTRAASSGARRASGPRAAAGANGTPSEDASSRVCLACHASGVVISRLGGSASTVRCPWCEGSGEWRSGADAQAHWRSDGEAPAGPAAEPDPASL